MNCALPINPSYGINGDEKWKAILDSVMDFITASKTMLDVLNERVKNDDKISEEELQRLVNEELKLATYRASLHVDQPNDTNPKAEQKLIYTETLSDVLNSSAPDAYAIGDDLEKQDKEPLVTDHLTHCVNEHGDKIQDSECSPAKKDCVDLCPSGHLISTVCFNEINSSIKLDDEPKPKLLKSSVEIQSDFSDQMVSIELPSMDDEEKLRLMECQEKSTSSLIESGNNPMYCRHGKLLSQKCHYGNTSCPSIKRSIQTMKEEDKFEDSKSKYSSQVPIHPNVQPRSRIPKSKNFETRCKITRVEKHPHEGSNIGKQPCKHCRKGNTYSGLRSKSEAQKGDNN